MDDDAQLHEKMLAMNEALLLSALRQQELAETAEQLNQQLRAQIVERKRYEAELTEAREIAEKASLAKSNFLTSMSHELRTPLHAILGFAQLMESGYPPPPPAQKANLEHILKAGWYLLALINQILDLAQIESGKVKLALEPVSLTEVLQECRDMIKPQARQRNLRTTFPQLESPCLVMADRTRVKQVLVSLLSNAIKYNRSLGTIDVECTPGRSAPDLIRISVRDSGKGLSPGQLHQLFEPFNRLGQEGGLEEGNGIGLVVCKQLIETMGGAIGVESTVGVGSVFWIELPATGVAQVNLPAAAGASLAPPAEIVGKPLRTVLYVEDNPDNLELVKRLFARHPDLRLLAAADGLRGIESARANQPDVILMDINMPGINGIEAMEILRADPSTAHIPVIAVSANAMPVDIEKGLDAGFFNYITKPIKFDPFMEALRAALACSPLAAEPTAGKEAT